MYSSDYFDCLGLKIWLCCWWRFPLEFAQQLIETALSVCHKSVDKIYEPTSITFTSSWPSNLWLPSSSLMGSSSGGSCNKLFITSVQADEFRNAGAAKSRLIKVNRGKSSDYREVLLLYLLLLVRKNADVLFKCGTQKNKLASMTQAVKLQT